MERTFLRATVQLGHCLLEGTFSHTLVAARDSLLYLTQVTPDAAAACADYREAARLQAELKTVE